MAYTSSPQFQTYKSVTIPIDGSDFFRSGDLSVNRDLQIVNMHYDRVTDENKVRQLRLVKRPGLALSAYNLTKAVATDPIRGFFADEDTNTFYWAVKDKVYSVSPDVGTTVRLVQTLASTTGKVGFCSYLRQAPAERYIIFSTGTELFYDEPATITCTAITSNCPFPHQPDPLYINGYLVVIKTGTGEIYNSDFDDPTTWTVGSFVAAEISSDSALRLFKAKNYMICLGYNSVEYFWDAGNAPPDSPFSRNDSPIRTVGYVTGGCQSGDFIYFVGKDHDQNLSVFMINSFKVERISNSAVDRTLQSFNTTDNAKGKITLDIDGFSVSCNGHNFYVLTTPQTTWAYDVDDKFWYEWKGSDGAGLKIEAAWNMYNGGCYVALDDATYISRMSPFVYQDHGSNFTCRYTTENVSFDTFNWKVGNRLMLDCSMHQYTGTSNAAVSWSNNDWGDANVVTSRNINVFSSSPYISRLGRFRARSFRVEYTDNYPFFLNNIQLELNVMGN